MKWLFRLVLPALVLASCSDEIGSSLDPVSPSTKVEDVSNGMITLGSKLDNPYTVSNVSRALASVYPTRANAEVPATDLYVRFLPGSKEELEQLESMGLELFDYPLDYEISSEGSYYHDPSLSEDEITWQYSVVPADFAFPKGIRYELIDRCFIPGESIQTRGFDGVDWDEVEKAAYQMTGNAQMLVADTRGQKGCPTGKITITDDNLKSKKNVGVAGVKVVVHTFVKYSYAFTDENGAYTISRKYSAKPHYGIRFKNKLGFTIGLNKILVEASTSNLGKGEPTGLTLNIDKETDDLLFRRCAVNNAAYDYYMKCEADGISRPNNNIRFWTINFLKPSCTLMMHHGAILDSKLVGNYLGIYKVIVRVFSPDITIGSKGKSDNYSELYTTTIHELAHASHFMNVGTSYWSNFAEYVMSSYLMTGSCYGSGSGDKAGYCAVSEMWAYYLSNAVYKERYGIERNEGNDYWFHPQILTDLEKKGVSRGDMFKALKASAVDVDTYKSSLQDVCSSKSSVIAKTFNQYSN